MLRRLSIITEGGIEAYSFDNMEHGSIFQYDPQIIAGFMTAIQSISETIKNPIKKIKFANMTLYVRTYGDFGIHLLYDEQIQKNLLESYFEFISKLLIPLFDDQNYLGYPSESEIEGTIEQYLIDMVREPYTEKELEKIIKKQSTFKLAIIGLAKAGKSSLKNRFFENWNQEQIQKVQPTIGVDISQKFIDYIEQRFLVYDFGGQKIYRDNYLTDDKRWNNISILIFVVDIQNPSSFYDAKEYLSDVWRLINSSCNKIPKLAVFFHKCDESIHESLSENIRRAMVYFKEFINLASFHLTTIYDLSVFSAMIKMLYFSLPDVLLRKLLQDEFLSKFEQEILPTFDVSMSQIEFNLIFPDLKKKIQKFGIREGKKYGKNVQESWLKYIIGEWRPSFQTLSSKKLVVSQEGQYLFISIPNWADIDISPKFTNTIIDGLLEGILKTFQLDAPVIIKEESGFTIWRITL